jgi:hypothetical protein
MVTVTSPYDAVLSAPVWHARSVQQVDTTTRRPSKKQKRRESHYAKAAETVLAHCPRPAVVPVVSESSLTMLGEPLTTTSTTNPVGPTECPPSPSVPGTPRVTVSSDEEERSNSSFPSSSHSQRPTSAAASKAPTTAVAVPSVVVAHSGPRLKLLKKRILSTDSS